MNCNACQELLVQSLDGHDPAEQAALAQHLRLCAECRSYQVTTQRLQSGLQLLRLPTVPSGLSLRIVAAVQKERRLARRRTRIRLAIGFAAAACVLAAATLYFRSTAPKSNNPSVPEEMVQKQVLPQPAPAVVEVALMSPRKSVETAVEAMASLATHTTSRTMAETKKLMPLMEPTLPELPWEPAITTTTLRDAGQGVKEGFEPVTMHAKRAVGLLRRDMLPDF